VPSPPRSVTTRPSAAASAPSRRSSAANAATVGWRKRAASGRSRPKRSRTRPSILSPSSEWPPRRKKSSAAPSRGTPSSSAQIRATSSSATSRGTTYPPASAPSGSGSARRSSFPLGVRGSAGRATKREGTRCSGRTASRASRSVPAAASAPSSAATQATSRAPSGPGRASTTASRTPGRAASAASTSPGSTRKPRTFTWKSVRPRYSSVPSASQRARSPVRYARAPGSPRTRPGRTAPPSAPGAASSRAPPAPRPGTARPAPPPAPVAPRVQHPAGGVGHRPADGDRPARQGGSHGQWVTSTAASVGPYRLCSSTPGSASAKRRTSSGVSASPLHTTRRSPAHRSGSPASSQARSMEGTKCSVVIPSPSTSAVRPAGRGAPPAAPSPAAPPPPAARTAPTPTRRS
jgi:hypothetical protein